MCNYHKSSYRTHRPTLDGAEFKPGFDASDVSAHIETLVGNATSTFSLLNRSKTLEEILRITSTLHDVISTHFSERVIELGRDLRACSSSKESSAKAVMIANEIRLMAECSRGISRFEPGAVPELRIRGWTQRLVASIHTFARLASVSECCGEESWGALLKKLEFPVQKVA